MQDLAHLIMDLAERADPVGGLTAQEIYAQLTGVSNEEITDAVWSLLSLDCLQYSQDGRLVLHPTHRIKLRHENLHKMGTYRPIGPRDTLFNAAGDPIAVVEQMVVGRDPESQDRVIAMKVKLLIEPRDLHTSDGFSLNRDGELL